jgi:GNAT superfamily N-acetyltransferase
MRDWTSGAIERLNAVGASVSVVEESRRLVGAAVSLPPDSEGRVWVTDWYVHPLTRGYGFGAALLNALETQASDAGASELCIGLPNSAKAARILLRERGWKPLHNPVAAPESRFITGPQEPTTVWSRAVRSSATPAQRETVTIKA